MFSKTVTSSSILYEEIQFGKGEEKNKKNIIKKNDEIKNEKIDNKKQ